MSTTAESSVLIEHIVEALQSKKGLDILLMDLRASTDTVDYFILCSGTSELHVKSLAEEVSGQLKLVGLPPWQVEGYKERNWVLIDCVDIAVHIFRQETREFYALERLWGDAECTRYEDDGAPANEEDGRQTDRFSIAAEF
ncbi:MAG: ribosome silencing factor [Candidatus Latescibacteria bacterium]|nr:ribosome silencing factor [Candidatus Latescibacterota bacterium]